MDIHLKIDWERQQICIREMPSARLRWTLTLPGDITIQGENMAITLTSVQEVDATIQPVDSRGNPAPVDGVPVWTVSDPLLLGVVPAADGLSAVVSAVGPLGVGQVTVTADARFGVEVVPLTGILDVTIVAAEATTLNIATGVPRDQVPV